MNNENIFQALGIFLDAMRPFLVNVLTNHFPGEPWEGVFFSRLTASKQEQWNQAARQGVESMLRIDYHNLTFLASKFRDELGEELGNDRSKTYTFENVMSELKEARNKCQHFTPLTDDEKERAFSNMKLIANMLGMAELRQEIDRLQKKHTVTPAAVAPIQVTTVTSTPANTDIIDDGSPLQSWFRNCLPHYDIRSGVLDESVFAANLNEVALGTGPEVYNNPTSFFAKTYITAGLRDIANRVVRALNGEETENRVISLQTGFGGGKTHTLISIYHIVKSGARLLQSESCKHILQKGVTPNFEGAKVAVFTNNTTDVSQGRQTTEGFTIYTLWGELAYQLGGVEAYEKVKQNDIERTAPTSAIFKPIIENAGTFLILIDELADYCVKATSKKVGAGNLFSQTNSFMQTLTEVVSAVPKCVLIATLPASATEVADSQIGQTVLDSLHTRIVRIGSSVKPVDDEEIFEVVRRRLFEQINDVNVIDLVAKRYKEMFHNRYRDLPDYCDKMEYANKIKKSYPFHPELIEMFRQRWGSDSRFQRTRGVLRLLASIVQDLWKRRDSLVGSQTLIHTSDVNLENLGSLTGTITNLMGSNWETVMLADVYGSSSNARKIDDADPTSNIGQYHLTQGIATTLLMASVGAKQNKGLDIKQIKLCVLRPKSFNHNDVDGALNKLEQVAHYLYSTKVGGATYWFESKANINILIAQAKAEIKTEDVEAEIVKKLKNSASFVHELNVLVCPMGDIPEQKQLTLVILHPSLAMPTGGTPSFSLREAVKNIATKRGNSDRVMRNTIFYLACSEAGRGALSDKLKDFLACEKILTEYSGRLEKDQNTEVQNRKREYEKGVDEALIRAYNVAIKFSAKEGINSYELKNYASDFSSQIRQNLMSEIQEEEWVIKSIGRNLLDRINMLPEPGKNIQVKDLYETFLRFDDKPMIIGPSAVIETVNRYCSNGVFNVAFGAPGKWSRIIQNDTVPFLDVTNEDYWLVDTSVVPEPSGTSSGTETSNGSGTGTGNNTNSNGSTSTGSSNGSTSTTESKTYQSVTISGQIPLENYAQLFASFVQTLKNNNLKIEIKFTANTTGANPLSENSATVKSVKESASQLGLTFEAEE